MLTRQKIIMKNFHLYKSLMVAVILLLSGCEGFLEKKPLGQLTSDNFFQTEEQAVWAVNAIYNHLRDWNVHVFSYIGLTDIVSDDSDKGSTVTDANFLLEVDNFSFDPGNIAFLGVWGGYYQGIYRANLVLSEVPLMEEIEPTLQARLIAEAKFLRAHFYFNLVRWFGDIPLIDRPLNPDEYKQERKPASEVYALIIADLSEAAAVLPLRSAQLAEDQGRATKGAAQALLAKVYLTRGEYALAEPLLMEVIASANYALLPNFNTIFMPEGENSTESIFEVFTVALETGGGGSQYNEVQGVRGDPNLGWGFNRPSDDLVTSFETGDPRREATILYVGEVLPDGSEVVQDNTDILNERYNQKAWVPEHTGGNGNGPGNIRLLRYADVLLMAAEVLNENGKSTEALQYLNQVRARARRNNPFILPDITITDQAELRSRIWRERRSELALEQHRWFDLQRQQRAGEVMRAVGKPFIDGKHDLFPIPQAEIDLSGGLLGQNSGY